MGIEETELKGVFVIHNFNADDYRGTFVKTYNKNAFSDKQIDFEIRESYFSNSHKNVIRGMHFQLPPHDHEKLVYVTSGAVLDVILDLRRESPTYGNYITIELSYESRKSIFIPKGLAHGFKSLKDNTIMVYNVATEYNPEADFGIKYDSFGFNWHGEEHTISERDLSFLTFNEFKQTNPF